MEAAEAGQSLALGLIPLSRRLPSPSIESSGGPIVVRPCGAVIMPLIRCTRKLLEAIGGHVASSAEPGHAALLGDWYANLIRIERSKCVILRSERTLLTFTVPLLSDPQRQHCSQASA
jgi:hypothetical protein